ncbi:MAG: GNAT family N-acetyltransferase [Sphingobacterium sp.]
MAAQLRFKKYTAEDFQQFHSIVCDDQNMQFITGYGMSVAQASVKFAQILEINAQDLLLGYFLIQLESKEYIGECKLVTYRENADQFEIGYLLKKEYWRQGLGTQVCESMLDLARQVNPYMDVIGLINPSNIGSKKILEKKGFQSFFIGQFEGVATEKLVLKR